MKNKLIWATVALMLASLVLAAELMDSIYGGFATVCYVLSGLYLATFFQVNMDYIIKLCMGKKRKKSRCSKH